jgi:hypothetical protein
MTSRSPLKNADCALRDGRKKMRPPQGERKRPVKSAQEPFGLRRPRLLRAVSKPGLGIFNRLLSVSAGRPENRDALAIG